MKLAITQRRSAIGRGKAQKATIKALGIRHLNDQVVQDDSPQIRGMIKRVSHLIEVLELTVDG